MKQNLLNYYYDHYELATLFSSDIKAHMELITFEKYEHICSPLKPLTHFLFFVNGRAKVYNTLNNGKSVLLTFYEPLRVIGDIECVTNKEYPIHAQALQECHCIGIPVDYVKQHLLDDPKFLRYLCTSLGGKLDRASHNSSINTMCELENRLASYILATHQELEIHGKKSLIFEENLTHLAGLLGTSYRHLLRTLKKFHDDGILLKQQGNYKILNIEELELLSTDLYS